MAKLALVAALAGMFGFGYVSGGGLQDRTVRGSSARGANARARPGKGKSLAKGSAVASPAAGKSSREPAAVEGSGSHETSAGGESFPVWDLATSGPGLTFRGNNVEFAHIMQSCRDTETSWRVRTLGDKVSDTWITPEGEARPDYSEFKRAFVASHAISAHWIAATTIPAGDQQLNLRLRLDFMPYASERDAQCWGFTEYLEEGESWQILGGSGGCDVHELSQDGAPVVSETTYTNHAIGALVSSFIFPVDVSQPGKIQFLPASEGSEWQSVNVSYKPMSDEEVEQEKRELHIQ